MSLLWKKYTIEFSLQTKDNKQFRYGFCLNAHYKVCDDGEYVFLDENMNEIINITNEYDQYYVPDFLSIEDEGYGDYVHINIDGEGKIEHFDKVRDKINSYFNSLLD